MNPEKQLINDIKDELEKMGAGRELLNDAPRDFNADDWIGLYLDAYDLLTVQGERHIVRE